MFQPPLGAGGVATGDLSLEGDDSGGVPRVVVGFGRGASDIFRKVG